MSKYGRIEILVGVFVLAALLSLCVLAFKVSGLTNTMSGKDGYRLTAKFTEIGGLKNRARVTVAGVPIGRVVSIALDENSYQAIVTMEIEKSVDKLPEDTIASIATSGLIGDKYIMLEPGAEDVFLKNGGMIEMTDPAMVLERLIGQFLYKSGQ